MKNSCFTEKTGRNDKIHEGFFRLLTIRFLWAKKVILMISALAMMPGAFHICGQEAGNSQLILRNNWAIQSSAKVGDNAQSLSMPGYNPEGWYPTTMPTTVLAALVANKVYPDPYYGNNFKSLPGLIPERKWDMPEGSPFKAPWWYRTEFSLPENFKGKHTWISFHSINYKANLWINGRLYADTTTLEGAYRLFNLDITDFVKPGEKNCIALEILPPKGMDLTITWVDWNPTTPDRGMGIWYDVTVHSTGAVAIEHPFVKTKLNLPSTDQAKLTVVAELQNADKKTVTGTLKGTIENISFSKNVTLEPGETREVSFDPADYPQLTVANPRLWWPHNVGPQNLYDLNLSFEVNGQVSDVRKARFGIREITSWMNQFDNQRTKVFQINGKNIVIRGGGYVQDLMLRPSNERIDADLKYLKFMNLNALRMEAPRGSDYLFERCDEEGILVMVGWCCCSAWERWKNWTPHTADVAEMSWHDQITHLRNHPSVFTWLYGSDNFPPEEVERRYIKVLDTFDGTRPYSSSATQAPSKIAGYTGLWMGPYPKVYSYFPPSYWHSIFEFNTEAAPAGEQIPPIETIHKVAPDSDLWPIGAGWELRLHKAFYPNARAYLDSRYGKPQSLAEYCMKSQVFQQEAVKAMYEAFAGNKYKSSGIIYWMYNSAWPKFYWQLYDYFFMPNGAFYGAKTACEPLHIQYNYKENAVQVVNSLYQEFAGLKASAKVYDFNLKELFSKEEAVSVGQDESKKLFTVDLPAIPTDIYYLKLELHDASGKLVSSNFYWLSAKGDEKADFTGFANLPETSVKVTSGSLQKDGDHFAFDATIENTGKGLAFAVNPKILQAGSGEPVLPVYWSDNYISLLPGEKKTVHVEFSGRYASGKLRLKVDGWNVKPVEQNL